MAKTLQGSLVVRCPTNGQALAPISRMSFADYADSRGAKKLYSMQAVTREPCSVCGGAHIWENGDVVWEQDKP